MTAPSCLTTWARSKPPWIQSLWLLLAKTTRRRTQGGPEVPSALTGVGLSPVPGLPAATLTQLLQPHGLVALQSVRQGQKDSVNVLFLCRVLGRRLKQREIVAVGEALRSRGRDLPAVPQVALVAHHDARNHGPHRVAAALVDPLWDALEGGEACHVVHEDDRVDAAVVVLHHASPEALLARCVPDLQLKRQKHLMIGQIQKYNVGKCRQAYAILYSHNVTDFFLLHSNSVASTYSHWGCYQLIVLSEFN